MNNHNKLAETNLDTTSITLLLTPSNYLICALDSTAVRNNSHYFSFNNN